MNDNINYIPSNTPDFQTELAEKLAELAPEAIADGKIDVEKLEELLNGDADESNERFGLFWPGKKRALRAAQQPTTATLKPDLENSKDWDTTKNVFIEGDNLEVLKVLQKHYHGKIKMIYIDPPYNTGKDFVYPDNFKEGLDTYLEWTKQVNEEGQKLSTNSESEGRYHSNWLNMMYPRLKLARNLLANDGVIFISIDDSEQANLRKVCDEIFGERNFIANIVVDATPKNDPLLIATSHEYVLVYVKNANSAKEAVWGKPHPLTGKILKLIQGKSPEEATEALRDFYKNEGLSKDNIANYKYVDENGVFRTGPLDDPQSRGPKDERINPKTGKALKIPSRGWSCNIETWGKWVSQGLIYFPEQEDALAAKKTYLTLDKLDVGRSVIKMQTRKSTNWLNSLFGVKKIFDHPKPIDLIKGFLELENGKQSIVLDFFAGSGTLGEAVMQLNAEDRGCRRHIQVQLPEPTPENSEARKAGYSTISELSRERIRRAGEKIQQDFSEQLSQRDTPLDVGFRAYKLSDTNFSKWQVSSDTPANELEQHLLELRESANDNATPADLFVELLLKQGYSLTEDIGDASIAGLDLKTVLDADGDVAVLAYLDEHTKPTLDQLREIADSKPVRFVILEDCFQGDDELKTNLVQICKTNGIELWTA